MASESTFRTVDDGGYAFPQSNGGGMSMLEWYAGQALAGIGMSNSSSKTIAKRCFDDAEAMADFVVGFLMDGLRKR